jgi:ketosteroid isomerase-like protein
MKVANCVLLAAYLIANAVAIIVPALVMSFRGHTVVQANGRQTLARGAPIMKLTWPVTTVLSLFASSLMAQAPNNNDALEAEIRRLESEQITAVLKNDLPTIDRLFADELIVNAPSNRVVRGKKEVMALVRAGILDYAAIDAEIEAVLRRGDMAVVMGLETVKPRGKARFAGQTLRRRFTNVWIKRNGQWQLIARQATIISRD